MTTKPAVLSAFTDPRGYTLTDDNRFITEESLRRYLPSKYRNNTIHIFDLLDSTNTKAKQMAQDKAPHGTVVMARQQTNGRGRLGRSFFSPKEGVYLTLIIRPSFDLTKAVPITSAAAVAAAESIEKICGKAAGIKWVNDILVEGKKVCGILTEGVADPETGRIESLVIGIGINTATKGFPKDLLDTAGALEGNYSKSALAASVIAKTLDLSASIEDRTFIKAYKERSLVIGKTVKVYQGGYHAATHDALPSRPAKVLDIDRDGGLMVLYSDGTRETLTSGEISIRL